MTDALRIRLEGRLETLEAAEPLLARLVELATPEWTSHANDVRDTLAQLDLPRITEAAMAVLRVEGGAEAARQVFALRTQLHQKLEALLVGTTAAKAQDVDERLALWFALSKHVGVRASGRLLFEGSTTRRKLDWGVGALACIATAAFGQWQLALVLVAATTAWWLVDAERLKWRAFDDALELELPGQGVLTLPNATLTVESAGSTLILKSLWQVELPRTDATIDVLLHVQGLRKEAALLEKVNANPAPARWHSAVFVRSVPAPVSELKGFVQVTRFEPDAGGPARVPGHVVVLGEHALFLPARVESSVWRIVFGELPGEGSALPRTLDALPARMLAERLFALRALSGAIMLPKTWNAELGPFTLEGGTLELTPAR